MRASTTTHDRRKATGAVLTAALAALATVLGLALAPDAAAGVAQARVVSADPANWTPNVPSGLGGLDGAVFAFETFGTTTYAGGQIGTVTDCNNRNPVQRNNFVAFDNACHILPQAPVFAGIVMEMTRVGNALYVVGKFTAVNGVKRKGIVKLNLPDLTVDPVFTSPLNSGALDVALVNGRLIVAGTFSKRLIALDPTTGQDTGYINIAITGQSVSSTPTKVEAFAVNAAGTKLAAIGHFTSVGGRAMRQAFKLDLGPTRATLNPWHAPRFNGMCNPKYGMWVRAIDSSPDGSYFVITASGGPVGGATVMCDGIGRWEFSDDRTNSTPTWINWTGNDSVYSVSITGAAVYVGGHFRWLNNVQGRNCSVITDCGPETVSRNGIAAIDPGTGKALAWNPGKTRGHGVEELFATASGLYVGSDGARFAGEYREAIAFCPL